MTRFALCSVTHGVAAEMLGFSPEQAGAIGVAIATAIAAFKQRSKSNSNGNGSSKKRFVPRNPTPATSEISTSSGEFPTVRIGGFDVSVGETTATIGKFIGTTAKYMTQRQQVPDELVGEIRRRLVTVNLSSRAVFDVYRQIRDEMGI